MMNKERKKAYANLEKHGNEADGFCGAPIVNRKQRRKLERLGAAVERKWRLHRRAS